MTKSMAEVEKFIELRARGQSFEKISQALSVSKPVLLKWEVQYASQVEESQFFELQAVLEHCQVMRQARVEAFSSLLGAALQELKARIEPESYDLQKMPLEKLLAMALILEERLSRETQKVKYIVPGSLASWSPMGGGKEIIEVE